MNELQIFNNPNFGQIRTIEEDGAIKVEMKCLGVEVSANCFELLALACKMADEGDEDAAEAALEIASKIYHPQNNWVFNRLYGAVRSEVTLAFLRRKDK